MVFGHITKTTMQYILNDTLATCAKMKKLRDIFFTIQYHIRSLFWYHRLTIEYNKTYVCIQLVWFFA